MADDAARNRGLGLAQRFPRISTEEWKEAIRADLKGADVEQRLLWRIEEGLAARSFYRHEDLAPLAPQAMS